MRLTKKVRRRVDLGDTNFTHVRSSGTGDVFVCVGWHGEVKALVVTTPGRALKFARAIIAAVEAERRHK